MKTSRETSLPTWLFWSLGIGLATIIVLMPFHAFLSTWGGTAVGPLWLWKSWKEVLLVILAIATVGWVLFTSVVRKTLFRDRLVQCVVALVTLTLLMGAVFVGQNGLEATSAGLAMDLRYLVIAFLGYVLFRFGKADLRRYAIRYLIGVAVLLAAFGILQVTVLPHTFLVPFGYDKETTIAPFTLIDDNFDARRAFATLRGPNDYGAFLILPLLLSLLVIKKVWWRAGAAGLIVVGLLVSGSRSAWLGAFIAVAALVTLKYGRALVRSRLVLAGGVTSLVVVVGVGLAAISVPELRLTVFHSSPGDSSLTEGSTSQHWQATTGGVMRVVESPLGCGPGCAGPASYYGSDARISENYYVQIAEEVGIVGLALWLAISWQVARRLYEQRQDVLARALLASFVGLSVIGLWLHVWADDPLSLIWWGLAGAVLGRVHFKSSLDSES